MTMTDGAIAETLDRLESLEQVQNVRKPVGTVTAGTFASQPAVSSR
jgi:hypothetical protein